MNSAAGSFGLSFGLAFAGAIMLATLSLAFTNKAEDSAVLPPAQQRARRADVLEDDAQVMSNTQLEELLAEQPPEIRGGDRPDQHRRTAARAQVALLIPLLAGLLGLFNSFRMVRLPDPDRPAAGEALALA